MSADQTWCVHIIGIDDILPAESLIDAMKRAHTVNAGIVDREVRL